MIGGLLDVSTRVPVLVVAMSQVPLGRRGFEIVRGSAKDFGAVSGGGEQTTVAHTAEESADESCFVAVVHAEALSTGAAADRAPAALGLEELVILARLKAVGGLDTGLMGGFATGLRTAGGTHFAAGGGVETL